MKLRYGKFNYLLFLDPAKIGQSVRINFAAKFTRIHGLTTVRN